MIKQLTIVMLAIGLCAGAGQAAISTTGDVSPVDPATWTGDTYVYVGDTAAGTLDITAGDTAYSNWATLADEPGSTGDASVDGAGSTWAATRGITVGREGDASLAITNGATVTTNSSSTMSRVAILPGSTGVVTIDGAGSSWENTGQFVVGGSGTGTMHITNGGTMSSVSVGDILAIGYVGGWPGGSGLLNVDGTGSTWSSTILVVGMNGGGDMNITNGGQAFSSFEGYVGMLDQSTGIATIDGAGSLWQSRLLDVGRGTLNITGGGTVDIERYLRTTHGPLSEIHLDGGTVTTGDLYAAPTQLTGTGAIDTHGIVSDIDLVFDSPASLAQTITFNALPGQNITINLNADGTGALGAGFSGSGSMSISNGVDAVSLLGFIGYEAGSTGAVTVDGLGSTWTTGWGDAPGPWPVWDDGSFFIGRLGDATLDITDGGVVSSVESYIGRHPGSTGAVTVDGAGSTWTTTGYGWGGSLHVGNEGAGLLSITNGGLVSVEGDLAIDFDGGGDSFINMSTGGMLALLGQADSSLASFLSLIDGTDAIRYWDHSANGWADIAGATYAEDYTLDYLTTGDLTGYTMLTVEWNPLGDFDGDHAVNGADIDALADFLRGGLAYDSLYDVTGPGDDGLADGNVTMADLDYLIHFLVQTSAVDDDGATIFGTEYGDFNLDGRVELGDLTRLGTFYGVGDKWAEGNANRYLDMEIELGDLTMLGTYYGASNGGVDAIPEPMTIGLLGLGACLPLFRRKTR